MIPPDGQQPHWARTLTRRVYAHRATVFNLLAEVELWPALFPHIRSARVVRRDRRRRLIVVRAIWRQLPLGYTAVLTVDRERGEVTIRHLSRLTHGSVAVWSVRSAQEQAESADVVDVSVQQQVRVPIRFVGSLLARGFVGGRVARDLGQAMLERLAEVAEGGSLADRR